MPNPSKYDAMRNLRQKMILKKRILNFAGRREQTRRYETCRLKGDKFRNRDEFLETCEAAGGEVQFLDEDGFVHEAVPVDAGFHVAFPFVEVDVVTVYSVFEIGDVMGVGEVCAYLVSMERQHVAARWIMAHASIGRRIWL